MNIIPKDITNTVMDKLEAVLPGYIALKKKLAEDSLARRS